MKTYSVNERLKTVNERLKTVNGRLLILPEKKEETENGFQGRQDRKFQG